MDDIQLPLPTQVVEGGSAVAALMAIAVILRYAHPLATVAYKFFKLLRREPPRDDGRPSGGQKDDKSCNAKGDDSSESEPRER